MRADEYDYRWLRIGWFDQERPCDNMVKFARAQIPGERMPSRWKHPGTPEQFVEQFGEGVRWADTASYHGLLINGYHVFRIWTNAKTKTLVDVSDRLKKHLEAAGFELEAVPEGTKKKRAEYNWRFELKLAAELNYLVTIAKVMYGLG